MTSILITTPSYLGCHGTRYARGWYVSAYVQHRPPRGKLPCASGTYSTQEADTRSPYVQYRGSWTYVSAQVRADRGDQEEGDGAQTDDEVEVRLSRRRAWARMVTERWAVGS